MSGLARGRAGLHAPHDGATRTTARPARRHDPHHRTARTTARRTTRTPAAGACSHRRPPPAGDGLTAAQRERNDRAHRPGREQRGVESMRPWPNGQGAALRMRRLGVRVPPGAQVGTATHHRARRRPVPTAGTGRGPAARPPASGAGERGFESLRPDAPPDAHLSRDTGRRASVLGSPVGQSAPLMSGRSRGRGPPQGPARSAARTHARVAQWRERLRPEQQVGGSIPSARTTARRSAGRRAVRPTRPRLTPGTVRGVRTTGTLRASGALGPERRGELLRLRLHEVEEERVLRSVALTQRADAQPGVPGSPDVVVGDRAHVHPYTVHPATHTPPPPARRRPHTHRPPPSVLSARSHDPTTRAPTHDERKDGP